MKTLLLAAVASLLVAPQAQPAKQPKLAARVEPAFSSVPDIRWKTLVVNLSNLSSEELDVVMTLGYSSSTHRVEWRGKIAAKTQKRVFAYLPGGRTWGMLRVDVHDLAGKELLTQEAEEVYPHGSGGSSVLALMEKMPAQVPTGWQMSLCPPEKMPDRAIGFEGFQAIFMRDFPLDSLAPAQRQALLDWVRSGGLLVMYPGSNRDWLTSRPVQELAPVAIGGSEEITTLPALEKLYSATLDGSKFVFHRITNGRSLLNSPVPLAVGYQQGAGSVVVVPFDLERAPFLSWSAVPDFRNALIGKAQMTPRLPLLKTDGADLMSRASAKVNALPPFGLLLGLAVLFVILVGPVNFMVLRRMKMPLLMVLTVPAISAIFLFVVVGAGYVLRGSSTVTYDVFVLETDSGRDFADATHLFSLFSPSARAYDLAWGPGECGIPYQDPNAGYRGYRSRGYGDDQSDLRMDQTDRWTLRATGFSQWQTRTFSASSVVPLEGGIKFSTRDGLRIANSSPYKILRGVAVVRRPLPGFVSFGEIPTGDSRKFDAMPADAPTFQDRDAFDATVLDSWLRAVDFRAPGSEFILCILDRLPTEVAIDTTRSGRSDRICLLQVFQEEP